MDQAARLRALVSGEDDSPVQTVSRPATDCTRIIAVTSGKGGVGKTTIAVNLALTFAEMGKSVLIVDADLGLANVDVMLDIESSRHLGHLLIDSFDPDEVASRGPSGLRVISGGSGLAELADASASDRQRILEKLLGYCRQYEYVIVDTSPGIGGGVVDFLAVADEILLVTTPEPTSVRDTYAALKTIARRLPEKQVRLVVNSASQREASAAAAVLGSTSRKFLEREVREWCSVEPDAAVGKSITARSPLLRTYPRSAAAVSIRKIAKTLLD